MILGTTYSHRHIEYLSLDNEKSFDELIKLKFNIIRLCCYWDEIQPMENTFDFSKIGGLLQKCERQGQDVILTVGTKAPRWPEFYVPSWMKNREINSLSQELIKFVTLTSESLKNYNCIKIWQVENEPLDPSGPNSLSIPEGILTKEINILKNDKKKILVNVWGNEAEQRRTLPVVAELADLIGLDLYFKVPVDESEYEGPKSSLEFYKNFISSSNKPVWITELQAEPWEEDEIVTQNPNPPSINPLILKANYNKAKSLNPNAILLWGYEYWYWKKLQGDDRLWNTVKEILDS